MGDYIGWIRSKVGHSRIFLNFAGGCVVDDEGKVLLQKRSEIKNAWGFPGGAMELGESAEQTAIREIQEETGLIVTVDQLLGVYTKYFDAYPNGDEAQPILVVFLCSVKGGSLHADSKETMELAFFDPHEVPKLFNQQHQDVLSDFINQRRGVFR